MGIHYLGHQRIYDVTDIYMGIHYYVLHCVHICTCIIIMGIHYLGHHRIYDVTDMYMGIHYNVLHCVHTLYMYMYNYNGYTLLRDVLRWVHICTCIIIIGIHY